MRRKISLKKVLIYFFLTFGILLVVTGLYVAIISIEHPPEIHDRSIDSAQRTRLDTNCYVIGKNWIRKNKHGIWEMYVSGDPYEMGVINGKLSSELVEYQEQAFTDQIMKMIPSNFYRHFLKYFIAWFNRDLADHVTQEYKEEIFGVSRSASAEFDFIGSAYQRLMNYHAAHDIGHALQNLALVGCSSFGTWSGKSRDSLLLLGRNFDFYVGDQFAENKIVMFCEPSQGNKFMMVTWGGLIGVVSGMNVKGLSVTLNAAKSGIPSGSATPVSLLAREILQYAESIDEAVEIVKKRKTFVSESFMIGSAKDRRAVVIEKTPEAYDIHEEKGDYIVCTNHYQSATLFHEKSNLVQMSHSSSVEREERIRELLGRVTENTPETTAWILRDKLGLKDKFIGYGNEKSINQLISHHAVIFSPMQQLVWVSSAPWQLGGFIAYDLNKIFLMDGLAGNFEIAEEELMIGEDTFLNTDDFRNFIEFRKLREKILSGQEVHPDKLIELNPEYYQTYILVADQAYKQKNLDLALGFYMTALTKDIASKSEEEYVKKQIEKCEKRIM